MAELEGVQDSVEAWSDGQRWELLARILDGKLSIQQACERHRLSAEIVWSWLPAFRQGALRALDERMQQSLLARGAPPEALRFPELSGSLAELSIGDWIQTLYLAGKDATLTVEAEGAEHRLWCSAGTPIDAESGALRGEAAAYQILGLEAGRVLASLSPVSRDRTIHSSAQALLLEGARRKDEFNADRRRLYEPVASLERQGRSMPAARRSSLGPLALSWLPQRGATTNSRRALTGALLALPLLLCFARFGAPGTAPAASPPETYAVHCAVDPPTAALSLDRGPVGLGRIDARLPRDGQAHLLRASAEGFLPVTVLFSDAPPPDLIALERMPGATPSLAASSCAVAAYPPMGRLLVTRAERTAPSAMPALAPQRGLPGPLPQRMPSPAPSAAPSRPPEPSAAASKELANGSRQLLSEQHAPHVQIIE